MDRRDFLKSTGGAAAAAVTAGSAAGAPAAVARPAVSRGGRRLTLATPWARRTAGLADDAFRLARRIEALSEGLLRIEIVSVGAGGADAEMMFGPAAARVAQHPGFAFFAGLPGEASLPAADLDGWLIAGGGQALWDDLAAEFGVKPLLAGHTGPDPILWSKTPIASLDDFAGKRIFARGLAADVARGLGALPVPLAEEDAERAVSDGRINAAEWGNFVQASAIGLPGALPFGLSGALSRGGSALVLEVPLVTWHGLTGAERTAITAAASEEMRASLAEERAARVLNETATRAVHGAAVVPAGSELCAAIARVAAAVVAHAAAHDRRSAAIDASHMHFLRLIGRSGRDAPPAVMV